MKRLAYFGVLFALLGTIAFGSAYYYDRCVTNIITSPGSCIFKKLSNGKGRLKQNKQGFLSDSLMPDNRQEESEEENNFTIKTRVNPFLEEIAEEIIKKSEGVTLVDKSDFVLSLYKNGDLSSYYPIAIGMNTSGKDKGRIGDNLTPEGMFKISNKSICGEDYMGSWKRNLLVELGHQLFGIMRSPFGTRWIGLKAVTDYKGFKTKDWEGIGIHGLRIPATFCRYQTAGCVGLGVQDVQEYYDKVREDEFAVIKP